MKIASLDKLTFTYNIYEQYMEGDLLICDNLQEIIDSVKDKKADYGIVPLENRIIGRINSYDLKNLKINERIKLPVQMALGGIEDIENVKYVISKKEALLQCSKYINKNKLKIIEEKTTISGISRILNKEKNLAIICSKEALNNYGLAVYEEDISNIKPNWTIFGLISRT